jgi:hypothetical protein
MELNLSDSGLYLMQQGGYKNNFGKILELLFQVPKPAHCTLYSIGTVLCSQITEQPTNTVPNRCGCLQPGNYCTIVGGVSVEPAGGGCQLLYYNMN